MTETLVELIQAAEPSRTVASVEQRPYPFATSFCLWELTVTFASGTTETMLLKDFDRSAMLADARRSRPRFLEDPSREIETYRRILQPAGIGPRLVAAVVEPEIPRHWLVCEKWPGVELWQIGQLDTWAAAFTWLAALHRRFSGRQEQMTRANPALLRLDTAWFALWAERAREALRDSADARAAELRRLLVGYDACAAALAALPSTLVHGEMYPSNVLVREASSAVDVCPVDWEMAGIGPAMLDIAALVSGWDDASARVLLDGYGPLPGSTDDLTRAQLHFALQWLGWSSEWRPPAAHVQDWLGEALRLARMVLP